MISWYCARTKPRAEYWARTNLWERGLEVYLPQYLKLRRHARQENWQPTPLFPSYLFVRSDLSIFGSRGILFSPGVHSMVSFGSKPTVVPKGVISELQSYENDKGMIDIDFGLGPSSRFKEGDKVRIKTGPFLGQVGILQCVEDKQRVMILLSFLGRTVKSCVSANLVTKEI